MNSYDASKGYTDTLPPMDPRERADLEREAGHQFVSDEAAHRYRLSKLKEKMVNDLINELERP